MDTNNETLIAVIFVCVIPALLLGALITIAVLVRSLLKAKRHIMTLKTEVSELQTTLLDLKLGGGHDTILALEREVEKLNSMISNLQVKHEEEIGELHKRYAEEIRGIGLQIEKQRLENWLREAGRAQYRNEIEVEVKFIYPLLKFLGYRDEQIRVRETVSISVGRQDFTGEADWTVRSTDSRPILVIEAKAPSVALDQSTEKQARSYAFALDAPLYLLTNGRELKVFERKVQGDRCLVSMSVEYLQQNWSALVVVLGAGKW